MDKVERTPSNWMAHLAIGPFLRLALTVWVLAPAGSGLHLSDCTLLSMLDGSDSSSSSGTQGTMRSVPTPYMEDVEGLFDIVSYIAPYMFCGRPQKEQA